MEIEGEREVEKWSNGLGQSQFSKKLHLVDPNLEYPNPENSIIWVAVIKKDFRNSVNTLIFPWEDVGKPEKYNMTQ